MQISSLVWILHIEKCIGAEFFLEKFFSLSGLKSEENVQKKVQFLTFVEPFMSLSCKNERNEMANTTSWFIKYKYWWIHLVYGIRMNVGVNWPAGIA